MRSGTGAPRDERRPEVPDDRAYGERDYRGISSHQLCAPNGIRPNEKWAEPPA